jgi:nicotinamidase-related amidase
LENGNQTLKTSRTLPRLIVRGAPIAEILKPDEDDYFVLKPEAFGVYSTTLELLLEYLKSKTLILTGTATDVWRFIYGKRRLYARL